MSILEQCVECGRLRGYAENENDKICLRCKLKKRNTRKDKESVKVGEADSDK